MQSCCIQNSYFRIWQENELIFVEDSSSNSKVPLSTSMLLWLVDSWSVFHLPTKSFFHKKENLDFGTIRLAKFLSNIVLHIRRSHW